MSIAEVRWIELPNVEDHRGVLTAMQAGLDVPFEFRRVFFLHGVTAARGGHAHRTSRQFLVPVSGRFRVTVSDGDDSATYELTDPHRGLYVPPLIWVDLDEFADGAVCLVLTDTRFDEAEYVRDRDAFVDVARTSRSGR
jgi:dTDP-4-dehydrorhamnose 3,5-epimerase-like enzyme